MPVVDDRYALLEVIMGSMVTQAIYATAELGVADALADGPRTSLEVAEAVGADPSVVFRMMRLLASRGLFVLRDDDRFELAPLGDALRTDAPMSLRPIARLMGHPTHWEEWAHFTGSVRTGEPVVPALRGMSTWEFVGSNPEYGMVFGQGMGNLSELETDAVLAAYDFSGFGTIADVGGGLGLLLAAILQQAPDAKGVLCAPPTAEMAEQVLSRAGVLDRCTVEPASFFEPLPPGLDVYLLKHVLHDWPEDQGLALLQGVRSAIEKGGKLLVMEFVLPDDATPHAGHVVDLWLHLLVGGRERTSAQYADLLARAGFRISRIIPTDTPLSLIEAEPV